jgi:hypothetical protein
LWGWHREDSLALDARRTEPQLWSWAAVGVNSRRARGEATSRGEAVTEAIAAVGPLLLVEIRGPDGGVTRLGKLVDGRELPGSAA